MLCLVEIFFISLIGTHEYIFTTGVCKTYAESQCIHFEVSRCYTNRHTCLDGGGDEGGRRIRAGVPGPERTSSPLSEPSPSEEGDESLSGGGIASECCSSSPSSSSSFSCADAAEASSGLSLVAFLFVATAFSSSPLAPDFLSRERTTGFSC